MTGINEVARQIHENAVEHGWWDEERGFPEVLALIHSEVSEALEEYRNGRLPTEIYYAKSACQESGVCACQTRWTNARTIRKNADRTSKASRKEYRSSLQT